MLPRGHVFFQTDFEAADALQDWARTAKLDAGCQSARALCFERGADAAGDTTLAEMALPVEKMRGYDVYLTAMIKAENVVEMPARYRGMQISPGVNEHDLRVLGREWNANVVRLQLIRRGGQAKGDLMDLAAYDRWLEGELEKLDATLRLCEKYGLMAVVDLHSPPGGERTPAGYAGASGGLFTTSIQATALMLDRPLLGQRVFDVLRVIQLLRAAGHQEVHLAGKGWGALPAAFAALLSPNVRQVTLKHSLTSFGDVAAAENYQWPHAIMLPHVLKHFDLPDCYAELASKNLRLIERWSAADGVNS